ncbi:MAG: hypothetical protein HWN81_14895 [Candidatus Lokiarchaeota archaeon]|nr:hypothetical protein [Candidatus Lokiarchaeota archaeon]
MKDFFDKIEKITKAKSPRSYNLNSREINNKNQRSKTLVMGAPYDKFIAMAKAPITATMKAKYIGELIEKSQATPALLRNLGIPKDKNPKSLTLNKAFVEYDNLHRIHHGKKIPPSVVGVYTYLASKLGIDLKQLLAGIRKFKLDLIDRHDIACISQRAKDVCEKWNLGIESQESFDFELIKREIYSGNY